MKGFAWVGLLAALFLCGCAGRMLPGKLYALSDAVVLDFQIETSYGTGSMTATNPKTGEKFSGQYTATRQGGSRTVTQVDTFQPTQRITKNNMPGQGYTAVSNTAPTSATARGVLMGDQGTVIELLLDIQPGITPKGSGEGSDNKGQRYQVQF